MLRVRTVFSGPAGAPYLSTLYYTAGVEDAAAAQAAVDNAAAFWSSAGQRISNLCAYAVQGLVYVMTNTGVVTDTHAVNGVNGSGTDTGELLPRATQGLIRLNTGAVINNRRVQGKIYVPAPTEPRNGTTGNPEALYVNGLNTAAGLLAVTGSPRLVVYSPTHNATSTVSSAAARSFWAVLRSRRD